MQALTWIGRGCRHCSARSDRRRGRSAARAPPPRGSTPRARPASPGRGGRSPGPGRAGAPIARLPPAGAGSRPRSGCCRGTRRARRAGCPAAPPGRRPPTWARCGCRRSSRPRRRTSRRTVSMVAGSDVARLPMWLFTPVASGTRSNAQARRCWSSAGSRSTRIAFGPGWACRSAPSADAGRSHGRAPARPRSGRRRRSA